MHWFVMMLMMMAPVPWPGSPWPQAPQPGPPWPDVATSTFCETAPANLYCADFEGVGTCQDKGFLFAPLQWDCSDTDTRADVGGEFSGEFSDTLNANLVTDAIVTPTATHCWQFQWKPEAGSTAPHQIFAPNASAFGFEETLGFAPIVRLRCNAVDTSMATLVATGSWLTVEIEWEEGGGVGTGVIDVETVASQTCDSPDATDTTSFTIHGITTGHGAWNIDNILITDGPC